jgi:hypothetical protein
VKAALVWVIEKGRHDFHRAALRLSLPDHPVIDFRARVMAITP